MAFSLFPRLKEVDPLQADIARLSQAFLRQAQAISAEEQALQKQKTEQEGVVRTAEEAWKLAIIEVKKHRSIVLESVFPIYQSVISELRKVRAAYIYDGVSAQYKIMFPGLLKEELRDWKQLLICRVLMIVVSKQKHTMDNRQPKFSQSEAEKKAIWDVYCAKRKEIEEEAVLKLDAIYQAMQSSGLIADSIDSVYWKKLIDNAELSPEQRAFVVDLLGSPEETFLLGSDSWKALKKLSDELLDPQFTIENASQFFTKLENFECDGKFLGLWLNDAGGFAEKLTDKVQQVHKAIIDGVKGNCLALKNFNESKGKLVEIQSELEQEKQEKKTKYDKEFQALGMITESLKKYETLKNSQCAALKKQFELVESIYKENRAVSCSSRLNKFLYYRDDKAEKDLLAFVSSSDSYVGICKKVHKYLEEHKNCRNGDLTTALVQVLLHSTNGFFAAPAESLQKRAEEAKKLESSQLETDDISKEVGRDARTWLFFHAKTTALRTVGHKNLTASAKAAAAA